MELCSDPVQVDQEQGASLVEGLHAPGAWGAKRADGLVVVHSQVVASRVESQVADAQRVAACVVLVVLHKEPQGQVGHHLLASQPLTLSSHLRLYLSPCLDPCADRDRDRDPGLGPFVECASLRAPWRARRGQVPWTPWRALRVAFPTLDVEVVHPCGVEASWRGDLEVVCPCLLEEDHQANRAALVLARDACLEVACRSCRAVGILRCGQASAHSL